MKSGSSRRASSLACAAALVGALVVRPTKARAEASSATTATTGAMGPMGATSSMTDATPIEVGAFFTVGAAGLALDLLPPGVASPRWTGGVLFDDRVRDALSQTTPDGRARAATASDVGISTLVAYPFLDAAFAVAWSHHDAHAALELALTDAEAFSVTQALTAISKRAFARQRPEAQEATCDRADVAAHGPACDRADRNASFWSGHSAHAFTAAALVCTEHAHLRIYGDPWDTFACAASLTAAAAVGTLRVVADRHWTSDVLVGAAIGSLSGWLVPTLLRFRAARADVASVLPTLAPVDGGVALGVAGVIW